MTYEETFSLRDNPFCPRKALSGVPPVLMANLSLSPLRIRQAPPLLNLYSRNIGTSQCMKNFLDVLNENEYSDDPASLGTQSFVFVIRGSEGTGKTTLANWMAYHLSRCTPNSDTWKFYEEGVDEILSAQEQREAIYALRNKILLETTEENYVGITIDNLAADALQDALNLIGALTSKRVFAAFLISSDPILLKKTWDNVRFAPIVYETNELSPDLAAAYVRERITLYRAEGLQAPASPFFPFDENNIRESLESVERRIVTLRQLNKTLCNALTEARKAGKPLKLPLSLAASYEQMVA